MPPLLVASRLDPCGSCMARYLVERYSFVKSDSDAYSNGAADLFIAEQEALTLDWLDDRFAPDYYLFLSRHRSESGIPTLTCHTNGNFGSNEMGGRPGELAYSYPSLQKHYLRTIWQERGRVPGYQIIIEATHHGPTALSRPSLFVEIGSGEEQWGDANAISMVCDSVMRTITTLTRYEKVGIGLGGTHYPLKFTKALIDSDFALASVASKHSLPHVNRAMLEQMISKSIERVGYALMDWKGLGREKDRLNSLVRELGLEVINL